MALVKLLCNELEFTTSKPVFSYLPGFLNERFSDITVTVSHIEFETKSYKLHRIVLAGCSSVLNQSLELHSTLNIPFMSPAEFELLIVFMYTGEMHFKSVAELCFGLYAAKIYKWDNLVVHCSQSLLEKMKDDPGNAVLILQLDKRFHSRADNAGFFETLDKTIEKNYRKILCSPVIEQLKYETLKDFLQINSFSDVPEIEVFRTLLRWTKFCSDRSEDPEQLQEVAGDLIYHIRYNFIPVAAMGTEVASSGLLSRDLLAQAFQRIYDDKLEVPFRTKSRRKIDALLHDLLDQEEWHLVSNCTDFEHSVHEVSRWSTGSTICWNGIKKTVEKWIFLPTVADSNIQWKVCIDDAPEDKISIKVQYESNDEQFRGVSFRLFAVLEEDQQIWAEMADVLESSEKNCSCIFSKKVSELPIFRPLRVRIRVTWTELDQLLPKPIFSKEDAVCIKCRWQLKSWANITPVTLFSEPFGRNGVLYRIVVKNKMSDNERIIDGQLRWQYRPASFEHSLLSVSFFLRNLKFAEGKIDINKSSACAWIYRNYTNLELLDITVVIKRISELERSIM